MELFADVIFKPDKGFEDHPLLRAPMAANSAG
jgi:hypothetical protein